MMVYSLCEIHEGEAVEIHYSMAWDQDFDPGRTQEEYDQRESQVHAQAKNLMKKIANHG